MKTIAIIPARGGSKGIPRKNLRPMAGMPLIFYSIKACLDSKEVDYTVVSTDDDEIALFAQRFGAEVLIRDSELANDSATLDPVIAHAVDVYEKKGSIAIDIVLTIQPTSPLVTSQDIDDALGQLISTKSDTIISSVEDKHLCWKKNEIGKIIPDYSKRVNRQQLPDKFKETGAIIACRREVLNTDSRIGDKVSLYIMDHDRSHDIDNLSDFYLCESLLKRKRIAFVVKGNKEIGLGHAYRSVMLANELVRNEIQFFLSDEDHLAAEYIKKYNYPISIKVQKDLLKTILAWQPDLVINDILDTDLGYISALKNSNIKIVNFEDLGEGIKHADLVVNALYPTALPYSHVVNDYGYFCLRDEFLHPPKKENTEDVKKVILCFGGVDEGNLTFNSLKAIGLYCKDKGIAITVILGMGYSYQHDLDQLMNESDLLSNIDIIKSTSRISDYMAQADLAITSGGRTVFELSAMKVPTIVICQNQRELTHKFATSEIGVINLGHRIDVSEHQIYTVFVSAVENKDMRKLMLEKASTLDLTKGKRKVISMIEALMEDSNV
ncbi:N-acylneuraminate cytidylyltransferase [invertebrate metagenome]|uniref:N-acylneuraminate cytidylyltransferase n=1 Tax=invertebrate metagenome TaxID=1711999 RepID=A0A2H9TBD6_9ZZZZ